MSANALAPSLRSPRVSLLSSADIISYPNEDNNDPHPHWMGGISIYPLSAKGATGTYPLSFCPSTEELSERYKICAQDYTPFLVYATDVATGMERTIPLVERAKAKLSVVESYWVERMLWENPDQLAVNPYFTNADTATIVDTGQSPVSAFAQLDAAVATDIHDGRGMIHLTPLMFSLLSGTNNTFRREGNVWLSPMDNIVVPGRGYTGNGPNVGGGENENAATQISQWMYGHPGIIQIVRSSVETTPEEGDVLKLMNRPVNDVWVAAHRTYGLIISNGVNEDEEDGTSTTGFYAVEADLSSFIDTTS